MSDDLLGGVSSRDTGRGGVLLPEGFYPELRLVKAEIFRQFKGSKPRTFTCDVEVLSGPPGVAVGTIGSGPYEQLEGNQFPSYDVQGRARVMVFLGALFGYSSPEQIDANINGQTLALVVSDLQPSTGTVFSAYVTHKQTKPKPGEHVGKTIQMFSKIAPVLENGAPKVVRGKGQQSAPVSAPVSTPVAAAPVAVAPPPPPAAAPAAPAIPAGFALHTLPEYAKQGWVFEVNNPTNMKQIPGLTG